jgi:hypothetical protein
VYTRQAQADFESLVTERGGEDWRKKNNVSLDHTHYRGVINLLVCGRKVWRVNNKQPWVQRKKSKKRKKK